MERIQTALRKAKENRVSGTVTGVRDENLCDIVYTSTAVRSVSQDILKRQRLIGGVEDARWTETFRLLRTRVLQLLHAKGWNSLAVTSAEAQTGKSLIAVNLAISLAMEMDYSVLLVDANLDNPSLHNILGVSQHQGLSDYLTNQCEIGEILINPGIPKLVLLPGGQRVFNASELLGSRKMARLVDELKSRYTSRVVIFDVPPLINRSDALAFSPYIDTVLMVIEEGRSKKAQVKHALQSLSSTPVLGTILNKSRRNIISFHD